MAIERDEVKAAIRLLRMWSLRSRSSSWVRPLPGHSATADDEAARVTLEALRFVAWERGNIALLDDAFDPFEPFTEVDVALEYLDEDIERGPRTVDTAARIAAQLKARLCEIIGAEQLSAFDAWLELRRTWEDLRAAEEGAALLRSHALGSK